MQQHATIVQNLSYVLLTMLHLHQQTSSRSSRGFHLETPAVATHTQVAYAENDGESELQPMKALHQAGVRRRKKRAGRVWPARVK